METYVSITYRSFISILHFFSFQLLQAVFFSPSGPLGASWDHAAPSLTLRSGAVRSWLGVGGS